MPSLLREATQAAARDIECALILAALANAKGQIAPAARTLRVDYTVLTRKMAAYGITRDDAAKLV